MDLKKEETNKNEIVLKLSKEFETGTNDRFSQLKFLDSENEKNLRVFADNFKNEATLIFEGLKRENVSLDLNDSKVQMLVKELVDKAAV